MKRSVLLRDDVVVKSRAQQLHALILDVPDLFAHCVPFEFVDRPAALHGNLCNTFG